MISCVSLFRYDIMYSKLTLLGSPSLHRCVLTHLVKCPEGVGGALAQGVTHARQASSPELHPTCAPLPVPYLDTILSPCRVVARGRI